MSFINSFFIPIFYKKIGTDKFHNNYYESKKMDYLARRKRYVTYKGNNEPSKVPPLWHAWLHHLTNDIPSDHNYNFTWQKEYEPNKTDTHICNTFEKKQYKYISWKPE